MQKKSEDFSIDDAARLAKTPAGQQLLAILRNADPNRLQLAADKASAGDYEMASKILQQMLTSAEAEAILRDLRG